jgi:hypothetical protein
MYGQVHLLFNNAGFELIWSEIVNPSRNRLRCALFLTRRSLAVRATRGRQFVAIFERPRGDSRFSRMMDK